MLPGGLTSCVRRHRDSQTLDDDGAEPFLLLDASFRQSYTNWIVMHSSNQCDISFAVDLCAQIDESD